jgi:D-alanyl-lipoteichoic acid acyltransferase DltB (MBOAT superfamily)
MLFNSLSFLLFLPLVLAGFAVLPSRYRWIWLLVASYIFYAAANSANLIWLGLLSVVVYTFGREIQRQPSRARQRLLLTLGLIVIFGSLAAFKFYDFLASEVERFLTVIFEARSSALPRLRMTTPVGNSFYSFAAASYLIDVYKNRLSAETHPGRLGLYIAYFPKLLAGPIERATGFLPQLRRLQLRHEMLVPGLVLIVLGLCKKVVIADNLAPLVDRSFAIVNYVAPMELLLAVYFFAFQIYCDFSGYTDIAIGVSLLFGIALMENFRHPYLAQSTSEFWSERWHISLARWFRDYLYIPLGGSRAGPLRHYLNLMLVFAVSGLWHAGLGYGVGWTFLIWGMLNGFYQWVGLSTERLRQSFREKYPSLIASSPMRVVRILVTFHLIAFSWIFFRAQTVSDAIVVLKKIGGSLFQLPLLITRYPFTAEHAFAISLIAILLVIEIADERKPLFKRLAEAPLAFRWAMYYAGIFTLLLLGHWQASEFIYMRF